MNLQFYLKSAFLTLLTACSCIAPVTAQTDCNLVTSVTLQVPGNQTSIRTQGHVAYMNDSVQRNHLPLDLNQWQYIAITKDSNNKASIYKNGQLTFQGYFDDLHYSWSKLILGAVQYGTYRAWFNGYIDDVRISEIVRSENNILNHYNSQSQFTADAGTVGLWHLNQHSGTNISATVGNDGSITNAVWDIGGKFGECLYFNGIDALAEIQQPVPGGNLTCEFWIKPVAMEVSWPVAWYGIYTSGFLTSVDTVATIYTWSTGDTSSSITIDPSLFQYVSVSNGTCNDSIWFHTPNVIDTTIINVIDTTFINVIDTTFINVIDTTFINVIDTTFINVIDTTFINVIDTTFINVIDTTFINVIDTTFINVIDTTFINVIDTTFINVIDTTFINVYDTTYVSVGDTLRINLTLTGTNPPNPTTIILYPNPASTHLIIDFGDYSALSGFSLRIINALGQVILRSPINQPRLYFDLAGWTGRGVYFVQILDPGNSTLVTKKVLLL